MGSPEPLSAEDREIIATLELLEALELIEIWDLGEALPIPELEQADAP
jgi:hypothetical protein